MSHVDGRVTYLCKLRLSTEILLYRLLRAESAILDGAEISNRRLQCLLVILEFDSLKI